MQEKLFNRYFILIWFSMLCLMLIQNLMCSGIPLFFASRGFSTSFAGLLGLPFALFGILARTTGGYLMDRFGRRVIMILGPLLMGIASLLFLLLPFAPLMLLFRGLHGAGFSIGQAGSSTATIDVTPQEKSSLGVGIFWVSTALAIAVAGWLIEILGSGGTYDRIFYFSFAFGVLGAYWPFCAGMRKAGRLLSGNPRRSVRSTACGSFCIPPRRALPLLSSSLCWGCPAATFLSSPTPSSKAMPIPASLWSSRPCP